MKNDLIYQCCVCGEVRIYYHGNGDGNKDRGFSEPETDEELYFMHSLEVLAAKIERLNLGPKELAKMKIFINHGLCRLCAREMLIPTKRKKQKLEGKTECFATENCQNCQDLNCPYRNYCLATEPELRRWRQRKQQKEQQRKKQRKNFNQPQPQPL